MSEEAATYIDGMLALLEGWKAEGPASASPDAITSALRRCIHQVTVDAAGDSAIVHLRTLPVLAAGPAFEAIEPVKIDLR